MTRLSIRTVVIVALLLGAALWAYLLDHDSSSAHAPSRAALVPAGPIGPADGAIPDDAPLAVTSTAPALRRLDPALRTALRRAASDAARDGIALRVTSGWRSARYQRLLLQRAIATYGSRQAARRYVSTPKKSAHVRGAAVDIGPTDADDWLIRHGTRYGLCQIYANGIWHFELRTRPGGTCPALLPDASEG